MSVILANSKKLVLYGQDYGITEESLERYWYRKMLLGPVVRIEVSFEPLAKKGVHDYTMLIEGEEQILALSGCNCGYGGEGPHGTETILKDLGVPEDQAKQVFSNGYVLFARINGTWSSVTATAPEARE